MKILSGADINNTIDMLVNMGIFMVIFSAISIVLDLPPYPETNPFLSIYCQATS